MEYIIEQMTLCVEHASSAADNGDEQMVVFWANAFIGFSTRLQKLLKAQEDA